MHSDGKGMTDVKRRRFLGGLGASALALTAASATRASADSDSGGVRTTFVHLGGTESGEVGALYEPTGGGKKSRVAVFVMHAVDDYSTFSAGRELASRGYRVLCLNNFTDKSHVWDNGMLDEVLLQLKDGVNHLRGLSGVRKIVLLGHSGGATIMTAYQALAESGTDWARTSGMIHQAPTTLVGLPPADGVILADANWGNSAMTLFSVDPALTDETSGVKLDASLDMFNPANGFVATGSTYSDSFISAFLAAEAKRYNTLVERAQDRLAAIESGKGDYADDEPFMVPGAAQFIGNNRLYSQDVRLISRTRRAHLLLKPGGRTAVQVVKTVRVPENTENLSNSFVSGALKTTVRNFLSSFAARVDADAFRYDEDSVTGIDWNSTYSSNPGNVEHISAPLLTMGMTGHWEMLAAETIHDHSAAKDRSIAFVEGASHTYDTCTACETTPGEFGDTLKTTYDHMDKWLGASGRFID
jgi:hypothetical protein